MRSCLPIHLQPVRPFSIVRASLLIAVLVCAFAPCGCGGSKAQTDEPLVVGGRGRDPGRFSFPRGVDIASDGKVAVADRTGRIQILSPDGKPLTQWFMPKFDKGTPTRLLFDSSDLTTTTLLVVDTHNSRIMRYSLDGVLVQQFGKYGTNPDEMIFPTDIAVDANGTMYIAEYQDKHDRVMVYSRDGKYLRQFGDFGQEPGKFQRPEGIVFVPPDRLIVADTCNDRLQVFDLSGKLLEIWGGTGKAPGQFNYPYDLAIDKQGRVYVAEYGNNRIQVLDQTGRSIAIFGGPGSEPGQLGTPWGVALTAAGDKVWVADTLNHRLQKFDVKRTVQPLLAKQ